MVQKTKAFDEWTSTAALIIDESMFGPRTIDPQADEQSQW